MSARRSRSTQQSQSKREATLLLAAQLQDKATLLHGTWMLPPQSRDGRHGAVVSSLWCLRLILPGWLSSIPPPFFKNRNTSLHCILEMYNLLSVLTGHTSKSFPCLSARRGFGLKYKKKTSTYFNFYLVFKPSFCFWQFHSCMQ